MQGYRQDHDYDEEYLQDDRLRYGEDFDLDTTDTESTEHYDLDWYEDEGSGPREGGDYSTAHGTHPCPNPCPCPCPPHWGASNGRVKVGDIDIRLILCPDHSLNLKSRCERCEGANTPLDP